MKHGKQTKIEDIIREEIQKAYGEYNAEASLALQFIVQAMYTKDEQRQRAAIRCAITHLRHA